MKRRNFLKGAIAALVPVALPVSLPTAKPERRLIAGKCFFVQGHPFDVTNWHLKDCSVDLVDGTYITGDDFIIENCEIRRDYSDPWCFKNANHGLIKNCFTSHRKNGT